ncbi:MAG: acetyl-CoA carboxylase carboxyl transferase subunit beta [Miltoncostaeaceae bacterium]|nr:acetyl-CoA carboxylase carboxyl transferase subunit beta [Miltoncostaeaceae bacterium]
MSKPSIQVSVDKLRRRKSPAPPAKRGPGDDRSCPSCHSHYRAEEMRRNLRVCPVCGHHFPVSARERLDQLAEGGEWRELWPELRASDPLQFVDLQPYPDRLERAEASGLGEALVCAELEVGGQPCVVAAMDFGFLGGSMGSVVGEKLARACDRSVERHLPLIVLTASGGARMQEGVLALMQMAKTVVAFEAMHEAELPIVLVLCHPTTGGVWASFAALGDVTYAEPGALIAFSGPRVIEQTTRERLPEDFGKAEVQKANGQVDDVVDRRDLVNRISGVLAILARPAGDTAAPAVAWAQMHAERAARMAHGLPTLSKRLVSRVLGADEEEAPPR